MSDEQLKDNLIAEARSIQGLLSEYRQSQEDLQNVVNEFVNRDMQEESRKQELHRKVALSEMELCSNMDYLKFEKKFNPANGVIPTRRMKESTTDSNVKVPQLFQTIRTVCEVKSELGNFSPYNGVQLRDFCDLVEVLLGWRPKDKSFNSECDSLCTNLFSLSASHNFICCCNGFPLYPFELYDKKSSQILIEIKDALCDVVSQVPFSAAAPLSAQQYQNQLLLNSSLSQEDLFGLLVNYSECKDKNIFDGHALTLLTGDHSDNVIVVEQQQLIDTQLFRGFFFKGELRIIEHVGPEVDVMCLLCSVDAISLKSCSETKKETTQAEEERLRQTFYDIYSKLASNEKFNPPEVVEGNLNELSIYLTLAVKRQLLSSRIHQCTLVDVRRISPTIPFLWHLSWEELCSVGQKKGDATRTSEVVFKVTKVSVLELNASDALSKKYFSSINSLIER